MLHLDRVVGQLCLPVIIWHSILTGVSIYVAFMQSSGQVCLLVIIWHSVSTCYI